MASGRLGRASCWRRQLSISASISGDQRAPIWYSTPPTSSSAVLKEGGGAQGAVEFSSRSLIPASPPGACLGSPVHSIERGADQQERHFELLRERERGSDCRRPLGALASTSQDVPKLAMDGSQCGLELRAAFYQLDDANDALEAASAEFRRVWCLLEQWEKANPRPGSRRAYKNGMAATTST